MPPLRCLPCGRASCLSSTAGRPGWRKRDALSAPARLQASPPALPERHAGGAGELASLDGPAISLSRSPARPSLVVRYFPRQRYWSLPRPRRHPPVGPDSRCLVSVVPPLRRSVSSVTQWRVVQAARVHRGWQARPAGALVLVTRQLWLRLVDHRLLLSLLFCRGAPLRAAAHCSSSQLDLVSALRRRLSRPAMTICLGRVGQLYPSQLRLLPFWHAQVRQPHASRRGLLVHRRVRVNLSSSHSAASAASY